MAGELILIVEDNEKNLKLARDVLQFKSYRTLEARTAAQGIDLAAAHLPDLNDSFQLVRLDFTAERSQHERKPHLFAASNKNINGRYNKNCPTDLVCHDFQKAPRISPSLIRKSFLMTDW